jgi:hypothetical protein
MGEEMRVNLGKILEALRKERDSEKDRIIRHYYNEVCDRLDVLVSRVLEKRKK